MTRADRLKRAALRRRAPSPPTAQAMAYRAALRAALKAQQAAILDAMLAAYPGPRDDSWEAHTDGEILADLHTIAAKLTAATRAAPAPQFPPQHQWLAMSKDEQRAVALRVDAAADGGTGAPLDVPLGALERVGAAVAAKATADVARVTGIQVSRAMTPAEVAERVARAKAKGATPVELRALKAKLQGAQRLIGIERGDPKKLAAWRDKNVRLIKTMGIEQKAQLKDVLKQATDEGWHVKRLREAIQERFNVTKSHADLIARDQILTLNAELTRDRQKACGIEKFTWSTSGDERVRESHAELDGKVFSWDDLPSIDGEDDVIPGSNYQCRCVALAIVPWLDEEG